MEYRKGLIYVFIGSIVFIIGGLLSEPSIPRASINDLSALMLITGAVLFIYGVVSLKKEKENSSVYTDED